MPPLSDCLELLIEEAAPFVGSGWRPGDRLPVDKEGWRASQAECGGLTKLRCYPVGRRLRREAGLEGCCVETFL